VSVVAKKNNEEQGMKIHCLAWLGELVISDPILLMVLIGLIVIGCILLFFVWR